MHTQVVNIRTDAYDVYIGRRGRGMDGRWGNPFRESPSQGRTREDVIAQYRVWLWDQIKAGKITVEDLAELHGKQLGCFCAPQPCHGDVLAKAAAWAWAQIQGEQP